MTGKNSKMESRCQVVTVLAGHGHLKPNYMMRVGLYKASRFILQNLRNNSGIGGTRYLWKVRDTAHSLKTYTLILCKQMIATAQAEGRMFRLWRNWIRGTQDLRRLGRKQHKSTVRDWRQGINPISHIAQVRFLLSPLVELSQRKQLASQSRHRTREFISGEIGKPN